MEENTETVFDRLKEKGINYSVAGGSYLAKAMQNLLFPALSNFKSLPYERRVQFEIPEEYLDYLSTVDNNTIKPADQDLYIYGLFEALSSTVNYTDREENPEYQPVFWLSVGHRSDRGNFFICCDKASELYGQVGEFYDSSPFLFLEDFARVGNGFADFCENVLAGKVY